MIYIVGWLFVYYAVAVRFVFRYQGRALVYLSLMVLALIAFLRGNVGTDTLNYEQMLLSFDHDYSWDGREIGFVAVGWVLMQVLPTVEVAVRAISLVFFGFLSWFVFRSNRNELDIFVLYLLPVFAFSYSMNALRAAIALCFVLLVMQVVRKSGWNIKAGGLGFFAFMFHYSSLLPVAYVFLTTRKWLRLSNFFLLGLLGVTGVGVMILLEEYMMRKIAAYADFTSPSPWSGISVVVPVLIFLVGVWLGRLPKTEKGKLFFFAMVSLVLAWAVSQYSYAGLRILDLLSYVVPISVVMVYSKYQIRLDKFVLWAAFFAGLLSAVLSYHRFVSGYGVGPSPWLPYTTWLAGI